MQWNGGGGGGSDTLDIGKNILMARVESNSIVEIN